MFDWRGLKSRFGAGSLAVALGLALAAPVQAAPAKAATCDDACLTKVLDKYLDGLERHDVKRVPFAKTVRFSENNVMLKPGDGVWGTVSGIDHAKGLKFTDPQGQSAGYFGIVSEHTLPAYFALRIKVSGGKITEVESIVRRTESGPGKDPKAFQPDPFFAETLPANQRSPRAVLAARAVGYFRTLDHNDGKIFTEFADDCLRAENGQVTAAPPSAATPKVKGCLEQLKLGEVRRITGARNATLVVDEARGLVLSRAFLDHDGILTEYPRTDGTIMQAFPHVVPQTWCVLELFKVRSGKLARIQAVMIGCPYKILSTWTGK
ncbi:MAG: hypothetical protein ABIO39_01765 [Caulobacteraceae bacterium]